MYAIRIEREANEYDMVKDGEVERKQGRIYYGIGPKIYQKRMNATPGDIISLWVNRRPLMRASTRRDDLRRVAGGRRRTERS
ncbi:hypothetical protein EVAR_89558_1 [Eumeta japonica]|uniref:Uncharacterized protein n=1 Tax=Eumeta variegata TaxID=151549 RepID=A0A4C1YUD4_EUMVA|nr:hypothetical protein EVAR_89558_1 [Eumeta japonica]